MHQLLFKILDGFLIILYLIKELLFSTFITKIEFRINKKIRILYII